jgi:hypothetical protein
MSCSPNAAPSISSTETLGAEMINLTIDLQDGFVDDTVILLVNGEEILQKEHVSTKILYGFADSVTTEVEKGSVSIEIKVKTKDIAKTILLNKVSDSTYLGISIVNGMIQYIESSKPFGYQ